MRTQWAPCLCRCKAGEQLNEQCHFSFCPLFAPPRDTIHTESVCVSTTSNHLFVGVENTSVQKHLNLPRLFKRMYRCDNIRKQLNLGRTRVGCMDQYTQGGLIRLRAGRANHSRGKKTQGRDCKTNTTNNRKCRLETSNRNTGSKQGETEPCFVLFTPFSISVSGFTTVSE